ncbi:MAG: sulfatase [Actinomycetota bacterium]|nr:sulfatase [Actinomycetota bacterium]
MRSSSGIPAYHCLEGVAEWGGARINKLIKVVVVLSGLVVLFATQPSADQAAAREPSRPNVLIIITDDQRDDMSSMDNVRRLFRRHGRTYPEGYVTTPQCCPSRASIFTGRYVHNHGVTNNTSGQNLDPRSMLQYYLQRHGYRTGIFGKFLNGWGKSTSPPYFNKWVTFTKSPWYGDPVLNVNGDLKSVPGYSTTILGREARKFLRRSDRNSDRKPWMMVYSPAAPHSPATPAEKYEQADVSEWFGNPGLFEDETPEGRSDKPPYVQAASFGPKANFREKQLRTLLSVDDAVDEMYRTIDELDEENTIAFFISDNGLLWGEHKLYGKSVPYTEAVRVPFYARWPGYIDGRSIDERLVANVDITPTILEAARISSEGSLLDGRSLLDPTWERDRMLLEFFGPEQTFTVPPWASLRDHDYQYIEYYDEEGEVTFKEYYDLEQDPWQLNNLLGDDDPSNDPLNAPLLHDQLSSDRSCADETCP